MRIKNWDKFQHYKNRHPLWIKLYRDLLDDPEFHALSGDSFKMLAMCWLIASDDNGNLPDIKKLSFLVRKPEKFVNAELSRLSHWLEHDDSMMLAKSYQAAMPEERREEKSIYSFEKIWERYPNKDGKREAERHFKATIKTDQDWESINKALDNYLTHLSRETWKQPKNGSTWFNNWQDWINYSTGTISDPPSPEKLKEAEERLKRIQDRALEEIESRRNEKVGEPV